MEQLWGQFLSKRILLVEDDDFVRESLKVNLTDYGYTVIEAPNGQVARDIFPTLKCDGVISDVNMPFLGGIEFLAWLRAKNHTVPFILITGFSHLLESKTALEYGANDFLPKPFSRQDLKASLDRLFLPPPSEKPASVDEKYCKLSIDDFIAAKSIDYPIFIRVSSTKYLKIAHQGGKIDSLQASRYKAKNINHLWVLKEDIKKVLQFNIVVSKALSKAEGVGADKKANFLKFTTEVLMTQVHVDGTNQADFHYAKDFVQMNLEMISEDDEIFSMLESLQQHGDALYAHSLGVSLYSVMLAKVAGWSSPQNLVKVGMAGLFHDIGKKEIDREILEKPRIKLNASEIKLLESHVVRGREILMQNRNIPSEVVEVAYQHHEVMLGCGYPQRIGAHHIHPLAKIVAIADQFCKLTIKSYPSHVPMSAKEAIEVMRGKESDFQTDYLNKFFSLFGAAPVAKAG